MSPSCIFRDRVILSAVDQKTPFSHLYPEMPDYPQQFQDLEKQGYSTDPNYSQPTSSNTPQDRGIFSNLLAGGVASHVMRPQSSSAPSPALPVETDAPPPQCTFSAFHRVTILMFSHLYRHSTERQHTSSRQQNPMYFFTGKVIRQLPLSDVV